MTNQDFSDIAPYNDLEFKSHIATLVTEPGFEHAVKWVMPDVDYPAFAEQLKAIDSQEYFQVHIMCGFLAKLASVTTDGISADGFEKYRKGEAYTLISNHRDIVLDSSLLNLCLVREGLPTCEVAIGNNLLIYPWINDLVRLNKSFIVKRDTGMRGALEAAKHLSAYIHHAIADKRQSVWIAHREGRAKDSNDRTQESLVKMLGLAGGGSLTENLKAINLMPVAISYEYDPNDYLKAREFLLRKRDPEFKKSQRDDLFSMETGLLQQKGHVHLSLTEPMNPHIDAIAPDADKATIVSQVCSDIDNAIHSHYKLYPINYIAYDQLTGESRFKDRYTASDMEKVETYIGSQLAKVDDVKDLTAADMDYMRKMVLTMYANPLRNKLKI